MDVFSSSPHPPSKRIRLQENEKKSPLPHALQGEIARLGSRFSVWPSQTPSTKHSCALLKCSLSKYLIDVNTIQYNLHHRIVQYRANAANKMFIVWVCWLFRERNVTDWDLEVRAATYGRNDWPITACEISQPYKKVQYSTIEIYNEPARYVEL